MISGQAGLHVLEIVLSRHRPPLSRAERKVLLSFLTCACCAKSRASTQTHAGPWDPTVCCLLSESSKNNLQIIILLFRALLTVAKGHMWERAENIQEAAYSWIIPGLCWRTYLLSYVCRTGTVTCSEFVLHPLWEVSNFWKEPWGTLIMWSIINSLPAWQILQGFQTLDFSSFSTAFGNLTNGSVLPAG